MAFDHNFSVGQPDNIVFVSKFLDMIEEKIESLLCLYCEKVFKSREVLKEHMRKKQHKQLNPRNKVWNQFYLVNYLEFGRSWDQDAARDEEEVTGWEPGEQGDAEWGEWRGEHGDMVSWRFSRIRCSYLKCCPLLLGVPVLSCCIPNGN